MQNRHVSSSTICSRPTIHCFSDRLHAPPVFVHPSGGVQQTLTAHLVDHVHVPLFNSSRLAS